MRLIKPVQFIIIESMESENNELQIYHAILKRRNDWEKLLQRQRQEGRELQKALVREKCRNQIMMSNQHLNLRGDCLSKAEQFGLIRQSYADTAGDNQSDAERLARQALGNQNLANRVGQLEDHVEIQKLRSLRLERQFLAQQSYLDSLMERRNRIEEQIQKVNEVKPGMECPLKQKLIARIVSESSSNGRIIEERDCENGAFYEYIQVQIMKIKQMYSTINSMASLLPLKYSQYQELRTESQLSKQTFASYSQTEEIQREQDLSAHEERIDLQIGGLLMQIANQTAKEQHISSHCDQIARRQAISNAKQFALAKQKEVERKRKMVVALLPLIASTDPSVMEEYGILQSQLSDLQGEEVKIRSTLLTEEIAS